MTSSVRRTGLMTARHLKEETSPGRRRHEWLRSRAFSGPAPFLEPAAWALAAGFAVSALVQVIVPGPSVGVLVAVSALSSLILAAIAVAAHRVTDGEVRRGMVGGVGGVILANAIFRLAAGPGPEQATHLGLALVLLGGFLRSTVYLPLLGVAGFSWLVVLARYGVRGLGAHYTVFLIACAGVGVLLLLRRQYRDHELEHARTVEDGLNQDLRVTLGWYKQLFTESPALMCVHDTDGRIEEVNPAGLRALGYDRQDVVGRNIMEFMLPVTEDGPKRYLEDIQRHGWTEGLLRARRSDGSLRIWEYRSTILRTGAEVQVLATAADITELAEARDWVPGEPDPREG